MAVKQMFIDINGVRQPPNKVWTDPNTGETRVFIPSFVDDNKILIQNDPDYVNMELKGITDPALRQAWLEGNWDVFIGQAFGWEPAAHVVDPYPVPEHAPIYMTFDWGFGKPFSLGWWWVDSDGRVYRFAEWYGCTGVPDQGLRLSDSEVAEGICERESQLGLGGRQIVRLAGPDCFSKRPDYKGGGQGPSTAEVFGRYGIHLKPGDPDRKMKIRQFREYLRVQRDKDSGVMLERPMMVIYRTCTEFIRTIPPLALDDTNIEDIDTEQEDHVYDESAHICMARPIRSGAQRSAGDGGDLVGRGARAGGVF